MQELKLNGGIQQDLLKVIVNDNDEYIYINPNDGTFLDRFGRFLAWLEEKTVELEKLGNEKAKKYNGKAIVTENEEGDTEIDIEQLLDFTSIQLEALTEISSKIDSLFGQDTLKKYFRAFYEINPEFIPDADCINDFLNQIIPAVNTAYDARIERINSRYNKSRKGGKKQRSKTELLQAAKAGEFK